MKYYHNLYTDDALLFQKRLILDDFKKGKYRFNLYLIVLTKNERNHLEFYDSVLLKQKVFSEEDLFIVGIADGYSGALEVVEKITTEVYKRTSSTDIRKYILNSQKEFEERSV